MSYDNNWGVFARNMGRFVYWILYMGSAMTFTDDDLKRLKALKLRYIEMECIPYSHKDIDALLARLEAAEKLIGHIEDEEWFRFYHEWERAAGK